MKQFYFSLKILTVVFMATLLIGEREAKAQTLARGDIAFVKVNESTSDGFSFVALVTIPAGTQIYFTDNSWGGTDGWTSGEAHFLYTAPAGGLNPGTVVHCDETSTNNVFNVTGGGGTMVVQVIGTPNFSIAGGDQVIAYQSSTGARPANPSFIAAINTDDGGGVQLPTPPYTVLANDATGWVSSANWTLSGGSSSQGSMLPTDLINGETAVGMFPQSGAYVNSEKKNMRYDCTKGTTGTKTQLLALINNRANWVFDNNNDIPNSTVCSFTVTASCTAPTITANPPNRSICVNGNTTFTSNASGATAFQWQVNTGSGFVDITNGGVYSNATTNVLTITGATAAMNGYTYQCVAINGTSTCSSNTNSATLNISNMASTISKTDVLCFGTSTGSATVSAPTGAIGGVTYAWAPSGGTAATATGLAIGTYTVTISDLICQITRTITITQPASALNASTGGGKTDIACRGGNTGTATVAPTGGTPGYTYSWAPSGGSAATATGLTAGTYTVTVTDANNCQATRVFSINQPATALSAATGGGKTDVSCFGGNNGTATVAPTGGTPSYTYSWAPSGGSAATATGLGAGTYTVTVTDANACQTTRVFTINQPAAALGGTTSKTDVSCNGGNNGTATVSATGGTTPYSYSWAPSGGTNATATGRAAGTYTVTVTDFNGCQITRTVAIGQPATALSAATGGGKTDVSCNGGNNGTATVAPTGGTPSYTYSWAPSGGTAATATGLGAGTYTVTVTDANACQTTRVFTINQPAAALGGTASKTDVSCNGGNNGTATVSATGGTTPYSYSWAPSGGTNATATGRAAGTYTVTVTDFNGCQITRTVAIGQPATALSAATGGGKTDVSCNGGANGTATVAPTGGTPSYTYSWAPSGGTAATATGLTAGTYTVTVTDANACQTTRVFTINQPAAPLSAATGGGKTDVSCNGGANGTATVAPTGGTPSYTYSWAPSGGTAATATGLTAGTYTVTVTDANACQTTRVFTINQPAAALGGTASKTDVSCNGGNNGTATVSATGGTTPYSYSWAPSGGTNATATGRAAGTYTVTVTDFNGCQITRTVAIGQPAAALSAATGGGKTDVSCNGGANGTATVAPTGGTPSYTYSWAPSGGTAATATGLTAGTYTVTVTDANACQTTRVFTINQPTVLSMAYGGSSSINRDAAFSYTFAASGGTPSYTYSTTGTVPNGLNLSGGVLSGTPTVAGTFNFNVIATDANACTRNIPVSITVVAPLPVTLTDFTAKPVSGGVEVSWATASETNSSHFELMHATENGQFSIISRQEALGTSSTGKRYSFLHRQPAGGNNYYQLLQLDKNGDSKDYGVKTVYFTSVAKDGVSLYPNPAAHTVTVTFAARTYSQLQVTDMLGKVVRSQKIAAADTQQRISVEALPTGTYTIILTAEGKRSVHKLIKL